MSFQKILFSSLCCMFFAGNYTYAADLPFTDVSSQVPWYNDLKHMYDAGVIDDTEDHLFRPDGLLPRDEFVSVVVGVSCYKCLYPSAEDIIRYNQNPFVDIGKSSAYFYCISYAREKGIVIGYTQDASGKAQCQNKESFSSTPFCPANHITRIEAAAVLLRQSGLWDEARNKLNFIKTVTISDIDPYWYGYAQKAVDSGLVPLLDGNKIMPNEYITRKEFVQMASKIFTINMCAIKKPDNSDSSDSNNSNNNNSNTSSGTSNNNNNNSSTGSNTTSSGVKNPFDTNSNTAFPAIIYVCDASKTQCGPNDITTKLVHENDTVYDFGGYTTLTSPGIRYEWVFTDIITGKTLSASGAYLDNFDLKSTGVWIVKLTIIDAVGRTSTAYQQVVVVTKDSKDPGLAVQIGTSSSGTSSSGASSSSNSSNPLNVSAGGLSGQVGIPIDFFSTPKGGSGAYSYHWDFSDTGVASAKDPTHTFLEAGVYPVILVVRDASGNTAYAQIVVTITDNPDRDGDGVLDYGNENTIDACPLVKGPKSNKGCPLVTEFQPNENNSSSGNIWKNAGVCVTSKAAKFGSIEGSLQCASCPCAYSGDFTAQIRPCDIIFPSITSPDKKTLYSRGSIFQIP